MTRGRSPAPLVEDAFAAWLAPVSSTAESGERLKDAPSSGDPISEERLIERALAGHSPSSRALANTSDEIVALARSASPTLPSTNLRDRILKDVASIPPPTFRSQAATGRRPVPVPAAASPLVSAPNEALGRLHAQMTEEAHRIEIIDQHGMRGGTGQEATDRALSLLIDQYAPFLGFEVVFVSTVVGDVTIHRVHRGFPPELGNLDIIPRELSFCTHTVSAAEPFIVEDAAKEAFFRQSALVQKYGCRAYLGVPLFAKDVVLGSLCGISASPQVIFPEDVSLAQRFATIAQALVTHDEAELERLVAAPPRYPTGETGGVRPIVLSKEAFTGIVEAQRQRIGAAGSTWLLAVPEAEWPALSKKFPDTLLVGVLEEGGKIEAFGVLVPGDHPDFSKLEPLLEKAELLG